MPNMINTLTNLYKYKVFNIVKKIFFIFFTMSFIGGCMESPMNEKIDGSSEKSFHASLGDLKNKLSKEELEKFVNAMNSVYIKESFFPSEKKEKIKIWQFIDGKTPNQIIQKNRNKKEQQKDIKPNTQVKLNKPFFYNNIEFTLLSVKIGEITPNSNYSNSEKSKKLLIRVSINNKSEGNIYQLIEVWRKSILTDNFKNSFKALDSIDFYGNNNITPYDKDFRPQKIVQDTIIFPIPLGNANNFKLIMKPMIYKKTQGHKLIPFKTYEFNFTKDVF